MLVTLTSPWPASLSTTITFDRLYLLGRGGKISHCCWLPNTHDLLVIIATSTDTATTATNRTAVANGAMISAERILNVFLGSGSTTSWSSESCRSWCNRTFVACDELWKSVASFVKFTSSAKKIRVYYVHLHISIIKWTLVFWSLNACIECNRSLDGTLCCAS